MTWVTPTAGLVVGAIAVPVLLLLYFLRLRRQTIRVSSTMLWETAVEDLHANSPFQRLRPSVLLLLQLLALLLVVLALMQPQLEGSTPKEGKHVILIDRSGSMTANDVDGTSRLEDAKKQAIDLVEQLHGGGLFAGNGGETMVIAFSDHAQIIIPFTNSEQQLVNAIQSIKPTHGQSSIEESLKLARAYTTNVDPEQGGLAASESAQLELFSDGRINDIASQALQRGESIRYHQIGSQETSNIGIVTIDAKRPSQASEDVQIFLSLLNTNDVEMETEVEISVNGIPIGVQKVVIPAADEDGAATTSVVFVPFAMPNAGVVHARILTQDAMIIDDRVSLVIPPPKELRVLVAEQGPQLVQVVLTGMPLAEIRVVNETTLNSMLASNDASAFDVIVSRDISLKTMPQGKYLVLGEPPPIEAFSTYVVGDGQVMLVANEEHPVMRFVRFEDIVVTNGFEIVTSDKVDTLLEGSGWPAVMAYRGNGVHIVYVAFDPIDSNWPYLRSFPFFIFNAVHYLGRGGDALTRRARQVGQSIAPEVPVGTESVTIEEPDGTVHTIGVDAFGHGSWGPIRLTGVHRVSWGENGETIIAINTPDEESVIASRENISIGATTVDSTGSQGASFIQLWPWVLGAVLVVLLAEWWVYQKKVGGISSPSLPSWTRTGDVR